MHYFDEKELKELEQLRGTDSFVDQVLQELDRIMQSEHFKRIHAEARRFLGFVVAATLLGRSDTVKESIIAITAYQHAPGEFNPLESRKISVAAGALRKRLARYYATDGKDDPVAIVIPVGTYVPEFHDRRVSIEVTDFKNWHPDDAEEPLCQAESAEVVHRLNETAWIRASRAQDPAAPSTLSRYRLRASLESSGGFVRLHIGLISCLAGQVICWRTFVEHRHHAMKLAQEVADAVIDAVRPVIKAPSTPPQPQGRPRSAA